jgi:large repetitive protein
MNRLKHHRLKNTKAQTAQKALGSLAFLVVCMALQSNVAFADIVNTATATGSYEGTDYLSNDSEVHVFVEASNKSMLVSKTASPNANVAAGDVVTYTYTVTNNGNVTLTTINLNDVHNGAGPAPVPQSETLSDVAPLGDSTDATANDGVWSVLAPGDTVTLTATYTVKQSDVDNHQ